MEAMTNGRCQYIQSLRKALNQLLLIRRLMEYVLYDHLTLVPLQVVDVRDLDLCGILQLYRPHNPERTLQFQNALRVSKMRIG